MVGLTSPCHSLTPILANERRKLVRTPDNNNRRNTTRLPCEIKCRTHMRRNILSASLLLLMLACNRTGTNSKGSFTADAVMDGGFPGSPRLTGKLYLSDHRLRVEWGPFADVFDLTQRKGWRIMPGTHTYIDLADKDLSTYAPEMTNGSICPHANLPSDCKLVSKEEMNGRMARKWDLLNPLGIHVYFWTDDTLEIALRCDIGKAVYDVTNLREAPVERAVFELPSGYNRVEKFW